MTIASQPSDYPQALDFLWGRINYERTTTVPYRTIEFKLDRMRQLLARLGDPQLAAPAVHLAGTKGKGSTAAMIAAALVAGGYRTGLYTSPHLDKLEERIVIDGAMVSEEELTALVRQVRPVVEELDEAGQPPTYFEITTAMAFLHFAQAAVDVAVLEVGLGGRLDSTNVCQPLVSLITSISFDHTRQLGNTLAAIAAEKAGILKPGVPVISGVTADEPRNVIQTIAAERGCPLWLIGQQFRYEYLLAASRPGASTMSLPRLNFELVPTDNDIEPVRLEQIELGQLGSHQAANAAVALAGLLRLRQLGWNLPEQVLRRGISEGTCAARIEVVSHPPTVVLDVAHNVASVEALLDALRESFPTARRRLLFATTQEKDAAGMLSALLPEFQQVVFTRYQSNPRSIPPAQLASLAKQVAEQCQAENRPCGNWTMAETPAEAWEILQRQATPEDLLCVTGSFFIAAEIRALLPDSNTP